MLQVNIKGCVPSKTYNNDFCFDCVAVGCREVAPNVYEYDLGFSAEFERWSRANTEMRKDFILSLDFRPRSSVWKTGMVLSNCVGTGDEGYRGVYKAVFYHVMPDMPKYEVGDRVVQMKVGMTPRVRFTSVQELSSTARGKGGFGSTGK